MEDKVLQVKQDYSTDLMSKTNVCGVAVGYKYVGGQKTNEICVTVYVKEKKDPATIPPEDLIPAQLTTDVYTDVIEVKGGFKAFTNPQDGAFPSLPGGNEHVQIHRPLIGGTEIRNDTQAYPFTGTLGMIVKDTTDNKLGILTNNHVIANIYSGPGFAGTPTPATVGDIIGQPAGVATSATFKRAVNIVLDATSGPTINKVDCAFAEITDPAEVSLKILNLENISVVRTQANTAAILGKEVIKSGSTTGLSNGAIVTAFSATIDVDFGGTENGHFEDQIITEDISRSGDSGSMLLDKVSGDALGLIFAGNSNPVDPRDLTNIFSVANPINEVFSQLQCTLEIPTSINLLTVSKDVFNRENNYDMVVFQEKKRVADFEFNEMQFISQLANHKAYEHLRTPGFIDVNQWKPTKLNSTQIRLTSGSIVANLGRFNLNSPHNVDSADIRTRFVDLVSVKDIPVPLPAPNINVVASPSSDAVGNPALDTLTPATQAQQNIFIKIAQPFALSPAINRGFISVVEVYVESLVGSDITPIEVTCEVREWDNIVTNIDNGILIAESTNTETLTTGLTYPKKLNFNMQAVNNNKIIEGIQYVIIFKVNNSSEVLNYYPRFALENTLVTATADYEALFFDEDNPPPEWRLINEVHSGTPYNLKFKITYNEETPNINRQLMYVLINLKEINSNIDSNIQDPFIGEESQGRIQVNPEFKFQIDVDTPADAKTILPSLTPANHFALPIAILNTETVQGIIDYDTSPFGGPGPMQFLDIREPVSKVLPLSKVPSIVNQWHQWFKRNAINYFTLHTATYKYMIFDSFIDKSKTDPSSAIKPSSGSIVSFHNLEEKFKGITYFDLNSNTAALLNYRFWLFYDSVEVPAVTINNSGATASITTKTQLDQNTPDPYTGTPGDDVSVDISISKGQRVYGYILLLGE